MKILWMWVVMLAGLGGGQAQNWPQFRGPAASGLADGQNLPIQWDATQDRNIAWKQAIPGLAHSSPIVWENQIFLSAVVTEGDPQLTLGDVDRAGIATADDLRQHTWRLYALDKATGRIRWQRDAHSGVPRLKRHVKASHSSQTPATDGRRIAVLFGTEGFYCYDMEGELLWKKDLGLLDVGLWGDAQYQWGPASSPVIHGDLVFVQNDRHSDSFLAAYDLRNGEEVWRVDRQEKPAWSTPTIAEGPRGAELITHAANYFRAYHPGTGRELWRLSNHDAQVITPTPVASGGMVIISGGYPPGTRAIHAIRLGGEGDLSRSAQEHLPWKVERGSPYTPTPIIYRDIVYVCLDSGILAAYDLRTGERLYRERLSVGSGFSASPVASDGQLYFASEDGDVFVVQAGREFELLSTNPMGEPLLATPAISGNKLLLRGRRHLVAVGAGE